jgi:F-type H+-transporting ATPase subunit delta
VSVIDRTYARALFQAARERGSLEQVLEELGDLVAALDEVPELRAVLGSPQLDPRAKAQVLEAVAGETDEILRNFLRLLVEKGRAARLPGVYRELERLAREAEGQLSVELTTAYALSEEEARAIARKIEEACGRPVELASRVDPALIGGLVLRAGSFLADASVRGRLERMRRELVNGVGPRGGALRKRT